MPAGTSTPTTLAIPPGHVIALFPAGTPVSVVTTVSSTPAVAFWQGMCILGRRGACRGRRLAPGRVPGAAGLVAFGLYQLVAVVVFSPSANGTAWYDWLYGMTSRDTVCGLAVGSVVAGLVLGRYTVVRDLA